MTFSQVQELGNIAYDLALAMSGDDYVAATAYEEIVRELQAREMATDAMHPCPSCGKGECPIGSLCLFCEADEADWANERRMQSELRHGG